MQFRVFCSVSEPSSSSIACKSPEALRKERAERHTSAGFSLDAQMNFLHFQNENELVACLINSMKLYDLLRVGAQHQNGDFVLNLLDPTSGTTPTSQELCCIFYARLFVRRSTNRAEISSANSGQSAGHGTKKKEGEKLG
jgi:hypothetical protein